MTTMLVAPTHTRPTTVQDFVGQPKLLAQLNALLESAVLRNELPDHMLLCGPPGLGKTSLAAIIAHELGSRLHKTVASACRTALDMALLLLELEPGDVLFIDEIHGLWPVAEELLGLAMEDGEISLPGKLESPQSRGNKDRVPIAPFVLVGATTRPGALTGPLLSRFGYIGQLTLYSDDELREIIHGGADSLEVSITELAATALARRSRGTPRRALQLLRRARDLVTWSDLDTITIEVVNEALELADIDSLGLDALDRDVLTAIVIHFNGGPVGVAPLATYLGEDPKTITNVCEPFLARSGLVVRHPRGRCATKAAYQHLNARVPINLVR